MQEPETRNMINMKKKIIILMVLLVNAGLWASPEFTMTEMWILSYDGPEVITPEDDLRTVWVDKLIERMKKIQEKQNLSHQEVIDLAKYLIERGANSKSYNEYLLAERALDIYAYYTDYAPSSLEYIKEIYFKYPKLSQSALNAITYFNGENAVEVLLEIDSKIDYLPHEVNIYEYFSRNTEAIKNYPRRDWIVSVLKIRYQGTDDPENVMYLDKTLLELVESFKTSSMRESKLGSMKNVKPRDARDYFEQQNR